MYGFVRKFQLDKRGAGGLEFEVSIVLQSNSRECVWMRAENAIRDLLRPLGICIHSYDLITI